MDVRCEKCQTEYELDESRLKPGGVTVKCTNCGHMFKIRKRANTNVGVAGGGGSSGAAEAPKAQPPPKPQTAPMGQPVVPPAPISDRSKRNDDAPVNINDMPSGPASASAERQWMVRLESGEQKTCRELATLQQWIVAGLVSRESLISRSGKTWKRLGDISELGQYFVIADEARANRAAKPTGPSAKGAVGAGTMLGVGALRPSTNPEDDLDQRTTGNFRVRPPTPPPPPPAVSGSGSKANPMAQTELAPSGPTRRPPTDPPPPPKKAMEPPPGRQTAAWASNDIKASESMAAMPQGPRGGKLSASPDEPAFAGKVRVAPSDRSTFDGKVVSSDDDDDFYPQHRGSRAGMWIALISLLVIGAAAGAVYMFVFKAKKAPTAQATKQDAGVTAPPATADASSVVVAPIVDAQEVAANPLDAARADLIAGVHTRMKATLDGLAGKDDPASLAMRARLMTAMAQGMNDRAGFVDKAEADKLRKDAKQIVLDAAPLAQRAQAAQTDNVEANLAMADVMRLQGKPAPSVKRYITAARAKAPESDKSAFASVALSDAQLAIRDGKLGDASTALASAGAPPDDMRIKLALALVAYAQAKPADAKAQVDQILATQPDHDAALAMYKKLETTVANTDPLPPEEGSGAGSAKPQGNGGNVTPPNNGGGGGGDSYDALLAKANKVAETNCTAAKPIYQKALDQKPNGVEALTGQGYCHLDAKEFSSAFSKFRAALLVSPRYEPALGGIAETYARQGNKASAIEAWNKYLEVFPGSAKAKKQLEILGVDTGGGIPAGGGTTPPAGGGDTKPAGGGDTKPAGGSDSTPPPAPAPAPAPANP